MATDELGAGTVVLLLAIIIIYLIIFRSQYAQLANGTIRLQVLVTRIALIFPLYAFLMYIALLAPAAYVALQLPLVIIEGYSLYCFFVLMVTNYGGPANTVEMIKRHGDKKCCGGCFPKDPLKFYLRIHSVLYQVMTTRIVITFLEIIFYYLMQRKENLKPLYAICLAIQSLMVLYCVVTFLVFGK